jgi:hypothetical protein
MKITGVTVMAAMVGTTVWAAAIQAAERQVTVCMGHTENLGLENQAEVVASDIFAGIGVKILWHSPRQCPAEAILVTFSNDEPASLLRGALAYAMPFDGTHIVVFYDRVKNRPGSVSCLLGHVIAHEVAHILQGLMRHSESGIMKAQYTGADYRQMTWEPLQFTDEDVMLIHNGLKVREASFAAVALADRAPVAR